jgi:hypothetical protein
MPKRPSLAGAFCISSPRTILKRMADLTAEQHQLLQFEETHPRQTGAKDEAIRTTFGHSTARYHQRLTALALTPEAVAAYPQLVKRITNRAARQAQARANRSI